jgi:hypothetical protein
MEVFMKTILPVRILFLIMALAVSTVYAGNQPYRTENKEKQSAWLGVMLSDVTPELVKDKDLKAKEGAYVTEVVEESPADSAGIKEGDVIVEFGGRKISDAQDLVKAVQKLEPGKSVSLVVMRGADKKTLNAVLGTAPKKKIEKVIVRKSGPGGLNFSFPQLPPPRIFGGTCLTGKPVFGLKIRTLNEQLAEYFGAPGNKGVLVEEVTKDGKADKAGFKAGDVIVKAGQKTVKQVEDFRKIWGAYDEGEKVPIEIIRKGNRMTLNLEAADIGGCEQGLLRIFENEDCLSSIGDGMKEYEEGMKEYEEGMKEYEKGMQEYEEQMKECDKGMKDNDECMKKCGKELRVLGKKYKIGGDDEEIDIRLNTDELKDCLKDVKIGVKKLIQDGKVKPGMRKKLIIRTNVEDSQEI